MYSEFEIPVPSPVQQHIFAKPGRAPVRGHNKQQQTAAVQHEAGYSDLGNGSGLMAEEQPDVSFGLEHAETETPAMLPSAVRLGKPSALFHNACCI